MKHATALFLILSLAACTVPTDPLPATEQVQLERAEDCHNEPDRSDDCRHNEPNG